MLVLEGVKIKQQRAPACLYSQLCCVIGRLRGVVGAWAGEGEEWGQEGGAREGRGKPLNDRWCYGEIDTNCEVNNCNVRVVVSKLSKELLFSNFIALVVKVSASDQTIQLAVLFGRLSQRNHGLF